MDNFPKSPDVDNLKADSIRRQSQKPKSCSYDVTSKINKPIGPQTASNAERYPDKDIRPNATEINWTNRIEQARSRQSSKKSLVANVTGINDAEKRIISAVDTKSILSKKNLAQLNAQTSQDAKPGPDRKDLPYFQLRTPKREADKISGLTSLNSIEKQKVGYGLKIPLKNSFHKPTEAEAKKFDEMVKSFAEGHFKDVGKLGVGYF